MKFRNLLEVGSSLQKDTKVPVIPLLSSTLKKIATQRFTKFWDQSFNNNLTLESENEWYDFCQFLSCIHWCERFNMFQHLHDLKAYQKTKNTLTTTPPNGDHDSKKRCVSPAGNLGWKPRCYRWEPKSYVSCCLFERNSVEPWTHPFWKRITQIGSSSQVSVVKLQKTCNQLPR